MINAPMSWQLTVGELRDALTDAPDKAVVTLTLRAGEVAAKELDTIHNLRLGRHAGMVFSLELGGPEETPDHTATD